MSKRPIDPDSLPSNNRDSSNETSSRKITLSGKVKPRKKKRTVIHDVRDITSSIYDDVLLPAIKNLITEFISSAIDMILYGDSRRGRSSEHRSYNRMYRGRGRQSTIRNRSRRGRPNHRRLRDVMELDEIIFDNRADAEATLASLLNLIAEYEWATVGDLYSIIGWSFDYTHERYGWNSIGNPNIRWTQSGYLIELPEPVELRR